MHRLVEAPVRRGVARPRRPAVEQPSLQRRFGNAATARLVQRKINYQGGHYTTDDDRPAWRTHLEPVLVAEYNARHGTSLGTVDYTTSKLARAHIGSFKAIQDAVAAYLNAARSPQRDQQFKDFVTGFTKFLDPISDESARIDASCRTLIRSVNQGSPAEVVEDANKLLGALNSLSTNLRVADKYLNSYLRENVDLKFDRTPGGHFSLNDPSRAVVTTGSSTWGEMVRTPEHGSRVVTSEGAVPDAEMTPRSAALLQNYPYVQPQIRSANVRTRLYGPSKLAAHAAAPASSSAPAPVTAAAAAAPVVAPAPVAAPSPQLVQTYGDGSSLFSAGPTLFILNGQGALTWVLQQFLGTLPTGPHVWQAVYAPTNTVGRLGVSGAWYGPV
jgi:hypothetical protein